MRNSSSITALALGTLLFWSLPGHAASFGQPVLVAEGATSGSILDFFAFGAPSGQKELSVQGAITEEFGTSGLIAQTLSFSSTLSGAGTLSIGGAPITVLDVTPGGFFFFDPFQGTPGVITYELEALLPVDQTLFDTPGPGETTFTYDAPYDFLGPFVGEFPERKLQLSIFFDGGFPEKLFEDVDDVGVGDFLFVEGPLEVTKITLATEGGTPVPAPIPEPTTSLLLLAGTAGLAATRRRPLPKRTR